MTHGMRAGPGAIDRVVLDNGNLNVHTIDDGKARGVAGSGLVSIAAALLTTGLLSHQGLFNRQELGQHDWYIQESQGVIELASADVSATRRSVYLKEEDIAQLQLARAALMAGIEVLLEHLHLTEQDIKRVLLAGAFGNYMDHRDAAVAGLFPPQLVSCASGIGNAAGAGAIRALVNIHERERAESVARSTRYVELSALADFNNRFIQHLPFPALDEDAADG